MTRNEKEELMAKIWDMPNPKDGSNYWQGVDDVADLISNMPITESGKETDLISREAVIDLLNQFGYYDKEMERDLSAIPSAVPKREKGEWIKVQSGDKDFPESIVCSKCKNENSHFDFNEHAEPIGKVFVTSKFCPNCGADMRPEPYKAESEDKE